MEVWSSTMAAPQRARHPLVTLPEVRRHATERRRTSGPALRAFFRIAAAWGLDAEAQLGLLGWPSKSAFYNWRAGADVTLPYDTLVRLSLVLGIYKALHILYPEAEFADGWMTMPNRNPLFGKRTPLDFVLRGGVIALQDVRRLLDARRGGWN
jgi:hypothetical protein